MSEYIFCQDLSGCHSCQNGLVSVMLHSVASLVFFLRLEPCLLSKCFRSNNLNPPLIRKAIEPRLPALRRIHIKGIMTICNTHSNSSINSCESAMLCDITSIQLDKE